MKEKESKDMKNRLICLFKRAMKEIEEEYFYFPRATNRNGVVENIYMERVYAYELYHQLRLKQDRFSPFIIHGEQDKSGHPIIRKILRKCSTTDEEVNKNKVRGIIPDMIIHVPGEMSKNLAIVEIKRYDNLSGIYHDLEKMICLLKNNKGYHFGILIIFGGGQRDTIEEKVCRAIKAIFRRDCGDIRKIIDRLIVLWHFDIGKVELITFKKLFECI